MKHDLLLYLSLLAFKYGWTENINTDDSLMGFDNQKDRLLQPL